MGLLTDQKDPTMALFVSEQGASKAASAVMKQYPDRVQYAQPKRRYVRNCLEGYKVQVRFFDSRPDTPLTNSDVERILH